MPQLMFCFVMLPKIFQQDEQLCSKKIVCTASTLADISLLCFTYKCHIMNVMLEV